MDGAVQIEYRVVGNGLKTDPKLVHFDQIIMAIDADSCLKLLRSEATFFERRVLGNVKYLYDVTVTHNDLAYMKKVRALSAVYATLTHFARHAQYYEVQYNPSHNAPLSDKTPDKERRQAEEAFEFASKNFRPLYYTMQYPQDKSKIEMSFDLTHYQPQFRGEKPAGPIDPSDTSGHRNDNLPVPDVARDAQKDDHGQAGASVRTGQDGQRTAEPPLERHVFQTIFLDRDGSSHLWTADEIDKDKKIHEKWWKQQSHRWQHYAGTVPWMMFINGKRNTQYVLPRI